MPSSSDTQFGKYVLIERIAAGGMAEIFRARYSPAPGVVKPVVIKKILPRYADHPRFVQLFHDEAKLAKSLKHKNIVEVFDAHMLTKAVATIIPRTSSRGRPPARTASRNARCSKNVEP